MTPPDEWSARKKWAEEFNSSHKDGLADKKKAEDVEGVGEFDNTIGRKKKDRREELSMHQSKAELVVFQEPTRLPDGKVDIRSVDERVLKAVYASRMGLQFESARKLVGCDGPTYREILHRSDFIEIIKEDLEVLPKLGELDARLYNLATTAPKASTRLSALDRLYKRRGIDISNVKPEVKIQNNIINMMDEFKKPDA